MSFQKISETSAQNDRGVIVQVQPDGRLLYLPTGEGLLIERDPARAPGGSDRIRLSEATWSDGSRLEQARAEEIASHIREAYALWGAGVEID